MSRSGKTWLSGMVWLSAAFRFHALFANSLHADEALFAGWARLIAVWRDPLLQTQLVDKPPLLFYLQAMFYPLLGPVEWAARLPDFIASLLLVPLVAVLAWRIYGDEWTAVIAAAFVALSPFTIQFSATAFTDPLLTTLLTGSFCLAVSRPPRSAELTSKPHPLTPSPLHPFILWSGFLFGLAVATKYQAWLFLPLLVGLALLAGWGWRDWARWLVGFAPAPLLLWLWEAARTSGLSLWSAQVTNFGGIRPIWSWELWSRLVAWVGLWQHVFGSLVAAAVFCLALLILLASALRAHGRPASFDLLFLLYLPAYFLLHWLLAIPVWDRYLLPAVPIVALVLGRGLMEIGDWRLAISNLQSPILRLRSGQVSNLSLTLVSILLLFLFPAAAQARNGRFPIGGRPTADQGASHIAQFLADAPYGTVLYDHWYSWQWRYHLFDKRVYVSWFPHPAALVEDLTVFGDDGNLRYIALPDSAVAKPVRRAIAAAGFQLLPVSSNQFSVISDLSPAVYQVKDYPMITLYQITR